MKCPHCGKSLKINIYRGIDINKRNKKNLSEPMTAENFIEGCRESKQRKIQIIGEYADQLKEMGLLTGEYTTRGEWGGFLTRNLRPAKVLEPFKDELIKDGMCRLEKDLSSNGGFIDNFTLETIGRYVIK